MDKNKLILVVRDILLYILVPTLGAAIAVWIASGLFQFIDSPAGGDYFWLPLVIIIPSIILGVFATAKRPYLSWALGLRCARMLFMVFAISFTVYAIVWA
jgi:hypothetical protein